MGVDVDAVGLGDAEGLGVGRTASATGCCFVGNIFNPLFDMTYTIPTAPRIMHMPITIKVFLTSFFIASEYGSDGFGLWFLLITLLY